MPPLSTFKKMDLELNSTFLLRKSLTKKYSVTTFGYLIAKTM